MTVIRILPCRSGAAAAEMALVIPLLLMLMMGAVEVGNYFLAEHILVKGVRDGAAYAARQDVSSFDCASGTPTVSQTVKDNTKSLVRTGQLSGGSDRLPNWSANAAAFSMNLSCVTTANATAMTGIFTGSPSGKAPVLTITAQLPYRPVLQSFGFRGTGYNLYASQQAVVTGA